MSSAYDRLMNSGNPLAQQMLGPLFAPRTNPFSSGLLGGSQQAQGGLLGLASQANSPGKYEQMAMPYAQWAAGQLQQYAPETSIPQPLQSQWNNQQQNALAQMWDQHQRQQRNWNSGGNA